MPEQFNEEFAKKRKRQRIISGPHFFFNNIPNIYWNAVQIWNSWNYYIYGEGKMNKYHTLLLVLLFQVFNSFTNAQTTYYVSASGDDANSGTSPLTPWKTIDKVISVIFVFGDVIKFRGGDTFFGQIQLNQSGLTIESYNTEVQKPVITGAI